MTTEQDVRGQLAAVQADAARVATSNPEAVILAAIEVLIEVAAGDGDEGQREYQKLQLYRGIRQGLRRRGLLR